MEPHRKVLAHPHPGLISDPLGVADEGVLMVDEGLEALTADECLRLVSTRPIGRVAVSVSALPAVFPVNYCIVEGNVYFFTAAGTKLDAATRNAVVGFQVDDFDTFGHTGWSVLVVGTAEVLSSDEIERLGPLRVRPWAPGQRTNVVRISSEFVSGRRIRRLG